MSMTYKTRGIVLRTVKYGETSLVATIFTRRFGVQAYIINGVRTEKKRGAGAVMLQPGAILEMEVYHHPQKSMNRIRECNRGYIFQHVFIHIIKHSIALYMLELMYKTLKQPEENHDLFDFCEDALMQLDASEGTVTANFSLYFSLHLAYFFGLSIRDNQTNTNGKTKNYLDLLNGNFTNELPPHPHFMEGEPAAITSEMLKVMQPAEMEFIKLNRQTRRFLLQKYLEFYTLHIPEFGQMKTLRVLQEVLD